MSLYAPYKAIGMVTDGLPFVVNRMGEETFLMTSIGSMFQVYRLDHLTLCLASQSIIGLKSKVESSRATSSSSSSSSSSSGQPSIRCLQAFNTDTFAAVGNRILVFDRTRIVRTYDDIHEHPIIGLLLVGRLLLSYDEGNVINVLDVKQRCLVSRLESTLQAQAGAQITCAVHPSTYLNKFVFGYSNGQLELWNINKKALVYTFKAHLGFFGEQQQEQEQQQQEVAIPAVTSMEQSPACDVLAVGFESGHILLLNLKLDLVLFSFRQDSGSVTTLSFRTDASVHPYLASGSSDGRVHIWNLGAKNTALDDSDSDSDSEESSARFKRLERKLQNTIEECHGGHVSRVCFLHGEPILVTSSADNSLKVWIFDSPDGSARLLRSREGHSAHPVKLRYYGGTTNVSMRENASAESCELISCGADGSVRLFNTAIEAQNRVMSQKPILKKLGLVRRLDSLPTCVGLDVSETRQRDWSNMVTIHKNHANAYLWNYKNRTATDIILRQSDWKSNEMMYSVDRTVHSTAVCLTACGNFCLVGSRGGIIYAYNVQSGQPRGSFPINLTIKQSGKSKLRATVPGNVLYEKKKLTEEGGLFAGSASGSMKSKSKSKGKAVITGAGAEDDIICHTQEVRGVFVDMTNAVVVSCGLDGQVIFWEFGSRKAIKAITHLTPQLFLRGFVDSNFAAVVGQDRVTRLYDLSSRKLTRRFEGHDREVTDVIFSPDGRRILTSSVDSTVRVYDIPTGRCLSWLLFGSPVLSMAMGLSGEHLCVAQAGKEGIFMYIDRSLYESVPVWSEPKTPTLVADSIVAVEAGSAAAGGGKKQNDDDDDDDDDEDDDDEADGDGDADMGTAEGVTPVQGQVTTGAAREAVAQLGQGLITMSALPRAYWTSLFNLEAIKLRNKPVMPPAPAPAAPFFLPTIVRGGSTPSFPTPAEYEQLTKTINSSETAPSSSSSSSSSSSLSLDKAGGKRGLDAAAPKGKRSKLEPEASSNTKTSSAEEEERVAADLATLGSAWDDDDDDAEQGDGDGDDGGYAGADASVAVYDDERDDEDKPRSHLIDRKTALPRCKLVAHLIYEYPSTSININTRALPEQSKVLAYLKTLPPPAVDLEIRALCTHEEDAEGLQLLRFFLLWFRDRMSTGLDFEVMEAYLHRTLLIYGETLIQRGDFAAILKELKSVHAAKSSRFRSLVQQNLCMLKVFANLPPL